MSRTQISPEEQKAIVAAFDDLAADGEGLRGQLGIGGGRDRIEFGARPRQRDHAQVAGGDPEPLEHTEQHCLSQKWPPSCP